MNHFSPTLPLISEGCCNIWKYHLDQGGEMDLIQRIDSDVTNMNTISKSYIVIAQNDTDLSCIKLNTGADPGGPGGPGPP